ncbi:MAG TPA: sigma-54 dependent transcriptional regulator [Chitinophagaceae bacterium]|nr:sigma-54 dependent transcriptional regulator [Chitinophagaceae bacterium]
MNKKILIIDDDVDLCTLLSNYLLRKGFETETAHTGAKGIAKFADKKFDAVICDYRLGDMDGKELIAALKEKVPSVKLLVITGYSDIKTAVEVIKLGAYDYITKPLIPDEVVSILTNLLQKPTETGATDSKTKSVDSLEEEGPISSDNDFFEGQSPAARALYAQVRIVAGTNYSIILYGESGTGKEVIARTIHNMSQRSDMPFVAMDCGTLSKELAGSELFGHVKGAFTGALQDKVGHFELANGGTLFLDEVGNLSVEVQATLLRVIQERKIRRVGGNKEMEVDVRLIVASNENLQEAYRKGKFREDLYHRFNEFSINLPPLRSRREDIVPLTEFFLSKAKAEINKEISGIDDGVLQIFQQYSWPGNLREFRNVIRRAVLLTKPGGKVTSETMPWEICGTNAAPYPDAGQDIKMTATSTSTLPTVNLNEEKDILREAAGKAEYETIMSVLQQVNFNKKKAAELLKIDRKTLYNKIKNFQPINKV